MDIICLLIWVYWLTYGIVGKDKTQYRIGLIAGSVVGILHFLERIVG